MIVFYLVFLIIALYKSKIRILSYNVDYNKKDNTTAIKGIFTFLIFMRHAFPYVQLSNIWIDSWFKATDRFLGQSIVCMFLFYTGFGIYESYKKNRMYFDSFLEKRFLKTLFDFDIAILFYWLMQVVILKKFISLSELVKALIGLTSLGNSNWYMFYIFIAYIITFVSFKIFKNQDLPAIILVTILTLSYIIYAKKSNIDLWWYDTALCVPLGMLYSYYSEKIDKFMLCSNVRYYLTIAFFAALYVSSTIIHFKTNEIAIVIFSRLMFTITCVLISMKISFNNKILMWLGNYSFSIYIIQRIPMIILQKFYLPDMNRYVFVVVSLILTLVLAYVFQQITKVANRIFFEKQKTM